MPTNKVLRSWRPERIRMDNGPEFIAKIMADWSEAYGIEFIYIQPGKPTQNAYIEHFNGSYRRGVLDAYEFENLEQLRAESAKWVYDYNHHRPHDSLENMPPVVYAAKLRGKWVFLGIATQRKSAHLKYALPFLRGQYLFLVSCSPAELTYASIQTMPISQLFFIFSTCPI